MLKFIRYLIDNCLSMLETKFQVCVTNETNPKKWLYVFRVLSHFASYVHTELWCVVHIIVFRKDRLAWPNNFQNASIQETVLVRVWSWPCETRKVGMTQGLTQWCQLWLPMIKTETDLGFRSSLFANEPAYM